MKARLKQIVFGILLIGILFLAGCSSGISYSRETLDSFANCLADKNVKEYGAFWCPNCAKQEKMFGSSHEIMRDRGVYIECDPRCTKKPGEDLLTACRGIEGKAEECLDNKIDKYPTWVWPDGSRDVGVQDISMLAQRAGCELI